MVLSVFEIFKIGVGPSSSHTMGPMTAAARFLDLLRDPASRAPGAGAPARLSCRLHGSLAFTGRGHATDRAVIQGLAGQTPETFEPEAAAAAVRRAQEEGRVAPPDLPEMGFEPDADLVFDYGPPLPGHANAMVLEARDAAGVVAARETYYSVGGGFVLTEAELARRDQAVADDAPLPFAFRSASQMLDMALASGLGVAGMMRANELARRDGAELDAGLDRIWATMSACIDRGLAARGELPGGLRVRRRAGPIHEQLVAERGLNRAAPHTVNDWLTVCAMAVNEENAAGGQVVTAPTNGAAGVIPAAIRYHLDHVAGARPTDVRDMLLTAAAIGGLIKTNASISGAECGCQAEVGSASAMAAAALAHVWGGDARRVENAAEIALEHHLGMTCDPIAGLVQVPCIERNGLGAVKAVTAASLALRGDGAHLVSLDACVETMRQTGRDMGEKYKETSLGGLAVNVPNC
ncbi:L-serine ammonia-lyase [Rubrimonas cliftonensis]|uniref:L-serine dehydratase n=1 Tax=Rubrimonas cliftonensis TaxID=89524 RepID=A0A1H3VV01_9RHOB|nr:L-serine ammonia-lyase [Rubrimonas cliftonensis]SDZ78511.1 L-serine ammonia-lyase [Rubrimonas cliftonensis]